MADVLSQAQIDALLNAVRSGEKDSEPSAEKQEKKYQKYDFSSPRKFTKDRIKMLNGIFDNYSRVISSRLNARLRSTCEVTVESIEEQRYFEFSNALTEGDVLGMIDVELKGQIQETPAMLFISTSTALSMMGRMLGGEGAVDDELQDDYSYTDLELKLYEDLAGDTVKVMDRRLPGSRGSPRFCLQPQGRTLSWKALPSPRLSASPWHGPPACLQTLPCWPRPLSGRWPRP